MTTTTNIQTNGNPAAQNTNNMEEGTMNQVNKNINMVVRISNVFRMENISKLIAGAAVGLALIIGLAMPGSAIASQTSPDTILLDNLTDDHSRRFGTPYAPANVRINAGVTGLDNLNDDFFRGFGPPDAPAKVRISSGFTGLDNLNDNFSLDFGTPDAPAKAKLASISVTWNDDFSLVFGTPDAPAKAKLANVSVTWNDDFSLVFGTPDAPAKAKLANVSVTWNDDFSLVFGTPDAPAKVGISSGVTGLDNLNGAFYQGFGTPDSIA